MKYIHQWRSYVCCSVCVEDWSIRIIELKESNAIRSTVVPQEETLNMTTNRFIRVRFGGDVSDYISEIDFEGVC